MQQKDFIEGKSFVYVDQNGRVIAYNRGFDPDKFFVITPNVGFYCVEVGDASFKEMHAIAYEYGEKGWAQ